MVIGQSQTAGIQTSPPPTYMSPTHHSPTGLGWSVTTAGVNVPVVAAVDVQPSVADNR